MKQAKLSQFRREELGFIFQDSNLPVSYTHLAMPRTRLADVPFSAS